MNWRIGKFCVTRIIQAGDVDGIEVSTNFLDVAAPERPHPTVLAKQVMDAASAKLIVTQVSLACEQTKGFGFDSHTP